MPFLNTDDLEELTMAKKNSVKKQELPDVFDFSDMSYDDAYDQETMVGVMSGMLEASNNQMMLSLN